MAQVWLVTGSSRGLGHAIVEAGLAAGNKVLATARDIKSLADLSERYGDQVKLFAMDVTDEAAAAANAVMAAVDVFGSLDVVINNAGYGNLSSVEDTPLSEFRAQIETNLFGTIIVTKAALRHFREKKAGQFIQFSSVGGRIGPPGRGPYSAAKWGVEGFSEVLSREVAPLGIKVTIVEPGGFRTDFAGSNPLRQSLHESSAHSDASAVRSSGSIECIKSLPVQVPHGVWDSFPTPVQVRSCDRSCRRLLTRML